MMKPWPLAKSVVMRFRSCELPVLLLSLFLAGCAGTGRRVGTLYETPMPQTVARWTVKDERCELWIDRLKGQPRTVLQVDALPEVQSLLARAMLPNASPEINRILSATETWSSFLFERTALAQGDLIEFRAERRGVDFEFDYHVPFNMPAVGIEVECFLEEGTELSVATQTIVIPSLSRNAEYWPELDSTDGPSEIPIYEPIIAMVTDTSRLIGVTVQPELDRGVIGRTVLVKRQKRDIVIQLASTLRHPPGKKTHLVLGDEPSTMYRLVLSWVERSPGQAEESETSSFSPAGKPSISSEETPPVQVPQSPPAVQQSSPPPPYEHQPFLLPLPAATSEW